MATSNTNTMTELINSEVIGQYVQHSIKDMAVMAPLAWTQRIAKGAGIAATFPITNSFSATTLSYSTEATAVTATAFNPTEAVATLAQAEVSVIVSKLADYVANPWYRKAIVDEGVRALVDAIDSALAALTAAFSHTVGTTNTNITFAGLDLAIATLEAYAKGDAHRAVFTLPSRAFYDLRGQLGGSTVIAGGAREDLIQNMKIAQGSGLAGAIRGEYMGYPTFFVRNVAMNSTSDVAGALFVPGEGGALGLALGWEPEVEMAPTTAAGISGQQLLFNVAFGVIEVNDNLGVTIIEDAN